jgi:hypothetical protein
MLVLSKLRKYIHYLYSNEYKNDGHILMNQISIVYKLPYGNVRVLYNYHHYDANSKKCLLYNNYYIGYNLSYDKIVVNINIYRNIKHGSDIIYRLYFDLTTGDLKSIVFGETTYPINNYNFNIKERKQIMKKI